MAVAIIDDAPYTVVVSANNRGAVAVLGANLPAPLLDAFEIVAE